MSRIQKGQKLTPTQKQLRSLARKRNQLWEELQDQRMRGDFSSIAHNITVNELNEVLWKIRVLKGEI